MGNANSMKLFGTRKLADAKRDSENVKREIPDKVKSVRILWFFMLETPVLIAIKIADVRFISLK